MFACALVIGVVLSGQISVAQQRYTPAGSAAPVGTGNNPPGNATGPNTSSFVQPPPTNGGTNGSLTPITPGGSSNPFRSSPPADPTPPRTMPLLESNSVSPVSNQSQSPPAAYQVTPPPNNAAAAQPGAVLKPSAMMRAMLSAPNSTQLRGQPVSLVDVVAGAKSRDDQTHRVDAYWDLCSSVADYYLGLREQEELGKLRSYISRVGPTWQQFETEHAVRIGTSQRAALASQLRVASFTGHGTGNLPLPADTPHCASYLTHFEQVFPNGAPTEARELATLLPLRFTELKDAAAAVTRAEGWVDSVARNDSDGTGTLQALRLLALQRRAFVQIARDYNRRIARYSELATPGQVSPERLTGMLIKPSVSATATRSAAPAPPLNRQSGDSTSGPPRTFADELSSGTVDFDTNTRDTAVEPASATQTTSHKERSLLVAPK